jgi:hypothetical protein
MRIQRLGSFQSKSDKRSFDNGLAAALRVELTYIKDGRPRTMFPAASGRGTPRPGGHGRTSWTIAAYSKMQSTH